MSLIIWVSNFPILGKNFPESHLIIITESLQNNITHILRYFNNFSDNITLNNFLLHVLNHALKRFLIEVSIDLINYGIHFYLKELRNYNHKLFFCPPQKEAEAHPPILNYYFSKNKYTLVYQNKCPYMEN